MPHMLRLGLRNKVGQKWTNVILILRNVFHELCTCWRHRFLTRFHVKCQKIQIWTSTYEHSMKPVWPDHCSTVTLVRLSWKWLMFVFDSTSCCDRDSVAWQLPAAFGWLFWLCGRSEVPSLVLLCVPAQKGFLAQIDVLIFAKKICRESVLIREADRQSY